MGRKARAGSIPASGTNKSKAYANHPFFSIVQLPLAFRVLSAFLIQRLFSFVPRCHGLCGSQDSHVRIHSKSFVLCQFHPSIPGQRSAHAAGSVRTCLLGAFTTLAVSLPGIFTSIVKRD